MNEITAFIAPALLTFAFIITLATAIITKAWRDGSLKADLRWVRGAARIYLGHTKTWLNNH